MPIYLRAEQEIQRKEMKLSEIKYQAEQEKRVKMVQMGIPDEEEIIRKKRERDIFLRDKFNLETFEIKYDKELRQRTDKKRKLEEEKIKKEKEQCTFKPDLERRSASRSPKQKSLAPESSTGSLPKHTEEEAKATQSKSPQGRSQNRSQTRQGQPLQSVSSFREKTQDQLTRDLLSRLRKNVSRSPPKKGGETVYSSL